MSTTGGFTVACCDCCDSIQGFLNEDGSDHSMETSVTILNHLCHDILESVSHMQDMYWSVYNWGVCVFVEGVCECLL